MAQVRHGTEIGLLLRVLSAIFAYNFAVLAFLLFAGLAAWFLRPLWPVWSSAIPGGLEDTRLFLWNGWWFRHALETHTSPWFTRLLFHPFGTSLISHDFPLWNSLITFAGQAAGLNLIAATNVWFALSWVLAGFFTYLLAREVLGSRLTAHGPAAVAGVYVMTHSYTLARAMQNWGQFNLWAIALFLWLFVRARRTQRTADWVLAGVALAWTAACHYYFLIYCGAVAGGVFVCDIFSLHFLPVSSGSPLSERGDAGRTRNKLAGGFAVLALLAGAIGAWIILFHPADIYVGKTRIGLESPANPLLVMWVCMAAWLWLRFDVTRVAGTAARRVAPRGGMKSYAVLFVTTLIFLSPLLFAAFKLMLSGDYPKQSILWKTHLAGANLLALFFPNPLNAWWGPAVTRWFETRGLQPQEQAGMIGWVALTTVALATVRHPLRPQAGDPEPTSAGNVFRKWFLLALGATVLSMGTYLHIAQYNLWLPLPFYLWRLLPVLGNVRVPERWMALGAIAWGVVLALALVELSRKKGWKLNRLCLAAGGLILL
jgi:hypothetical protein